MVDFTKQDMTDIWASSGDVEAPDAAKIANGWIVEAVPRQWWNWFENRQDTNIAYMLQKGIPEWDIVTEYRTNKSYIQRNNVVYKCIQTNSGQDPATATAYWVKAFPESSASLEAIRVLTPAADRVAYYTGTNAAALMTVTAFARTLLDDANVTTMRATLGAQASHANLTALSGVTAGTNILPYFDSTTTMLGTSLTAFGRNLLADVDAAAGRTTLGLGSLSTQNSSAITVTGGTLSNVAISGTSTFNGSITGGTITGITDLAIVDGGTGASTAAAARTNLGLKAGAEQDVTVGNADSTVGRLQKVGDYGWGAGSNGLPAMNLPSGDLNLATTAGVYRIVTGNTNVPAGYSQGALVLTLMWNADTGTQIITQNGSSAMRAGGSLSTTPTWTSWLGTWNTSNLIKTTSATDTTAGSMLKVGDFGLGNVGLAPTVTDANTALATGFYKAITPYTNTPTNSQCTILVQRYDNEVTQIATREGIATVSTWIRKRNGASTWGAWVELFHTGNQQVIIDAAIAGVGTELDTKFDKSGGVLTGSVVIDLGASGNAAIELGSKTRTNTPFIDFNSTAGNADYDSRILASGGTATAGQGTLTYYAASHVFNGAITASNGVVGNASTASKLLTARTISLVGDATGSVAFDGSADAAITVVVADDSHNHIIANVDGLQTALNGKVNTGLTTLAGYGIVDGITAAAANTTYLPRNEFAANFQLTSSAQVAGVVGSYAFARNLSGSVMSPGNQVSGGQLGYGGVDAGTIAANGAMPGNWRCMGYAPAGSLTVYLRYS